MDPKLDLLLTKILRCRSLVELNELVKRILRKSPESLRRIVADASPSKWQSISQHGSPLASQATMINAEREYYVKCIRAVQRLSNLRRTEAPYAPLVPWAAAVQEQLFKSDIEIIDTLTIRRFEHLIPAYALCHGNAVSISDDQIRSARSAMRDDADWKLFANHEAHAVLKIAVELHVRLADVGDPFGVVTTDQLVVDFTRFQELPALLWRRLQERLP